MGLEMVSCDRRRMTLTRTGCASLYRSAATTTVKPWEGRAACVGCALGAARAGLPTAAAGPAAPVGSHWCVRHEGPAERVIQGRVCVSCYNREREALGSTASAKTKAKPGIRTLAALLTVHALTVLHGGRVRHLVSPVARDRREAIEALATKLPGGFAIGRAPMRWPGPTEPVPTDEGLVFGRRWAAVPGIARQMELGITTHARRGRGRRAATRRTRPAREVPQLELFA